jgi:hypothetical protein
MIQFLMMMMWHAMCQQCVTTIVNLMTHDTDFNKISFIDWLRMFMMLKHVFYDLSYATIISNVIKKMIMNVFIN